MKSESVKAAVPIPLSSDDLRDHDDGEGDGDATVAIASDDDDHPTGTVPARG